MKKPNSLKSAVESGWKIDGIMNKHLPKCFVFVKKGIQPEVIRFELTPEYVKVNYPEEWNKFQ